MMFKPIPGNHSYVMSLNGEIRKNNGQHHDLKIDGNFVFIELYKKLEKLDITWLSLITHFEVNLEKHYKRVRFVDCNPILTRSRCGKVMCFDKPITINAKYRLIPNYPNYAITENGSILDIQNRKELDVIYRAGSYPVVRIYDPDRGDYKSVLFHRLMALAWCFNDDFIGKPIVNHKDGNKQNYKSNNLEWCSYRENSQHAIDTGLNKLTGYKVRDVNTGDIKHYSSFSEFCMENGLSEKLKYVEKNYKTSRSLFAGRFEIKNETDNTPWVLTKDVSKKKNKYTITLTYPSGEVEVFDRITDIMHKLTIWNISYNIQEIIKVAEVKYPGIKFDIVENISTKTIQALNVLSGEVIEAETIRKMSLLTDTAFSTIQKAVNKNEKHVHHGYVFRFKSDEPWPESPQRYGNVPTPIRAENISTGEVITFPSMKTLQQEFGVTNFLIKHRMRDGFPLQGWKLNRV